MSNYIEYDDETKQLAESLFNMLRAQGFIDDIYQAPWSTLSLDRKIEMYAIIDDIMEEAIDLGYDDLQDDEDETVW